jgi:hypothetical protein
VALTLIHPPGAVEIHKVLVLSTGHLKMSSRQHLVETPDRHWPAIGHSRALGFIFTFGWQPYNKDPSSWEDLRACLEFAEALNCAWVSFDIDGPWVKALPFYGDGEQALNPGDVADGAA